MEPPVPRRLRSSFHWDKRRRTRRRLRCSPRARATRWPAPSASAPKLPPAPRKSWCSISSRPVPTTSRSRRRWPKRRYARSRTRGGVFTDRREGAGADRLEIHRGRDTGRQRQRSSRRRQCRGVCRQRRRGDRARHRARVAQGDERHRHGGDHGRTAQRSLQRAAPAWNSTRRSRNFRT